MQFSYLSVHHGCQEKHQGFVELIRGSEYVSCDATEALVKIGLHPERCCFCLCGTTRIRPRVSSPLVDTGSEHKVASLDAPNIRYSMIDGLQRLCGRTAAADRGV